MASFVCWHICPGYSCSKWLALCAGTFAPATAAANGLPTGAGRAGGGGGGGGAGSWVKSQLFILASLATVPAHTNNNWLILQRLSGSRGNGLF